MQYYFNSDQINFTPNLIFSWGVTPSVTLIFIFICGNNQSNLILQKIWSKMFSVMKETVLSLNFRIMPLSNNRFYVRKKKICDRSRRITSLRGLIHAWEISHNLTKSGPPTEQSGRRFCSPSWIKRAIIQTPRPLFDFSGTAEWANNNWCAQIPSNIAQARRTSARTC